MKTTWDKGQLNSEAIFLGFKSPKNANGKIRKISALVSKMSQIKKNQDKLLY